MQQENWYPLGGRQSNGLILKDKTINKIAKTHKKSPAQIISDKEIEQIHKLNTEKRIFNPTYEEANVT